MFIKLCNLGKDTQVRYTASGKAVASLALAYFIGYGDNKKTQWIEAVLWGDRAQRLVQYLTKGTRVLLTADDLELEFYPKRDGSQGCKLKCRVVDIEFAGSPQQYSYSQARNAPIAERQEHMVSSTQQQLQSQYGDFDDDIPFMRSSSSEALG